MYGVLFFHFSNLFGPIILYLCHLSFFIVYGVYHVVLLLIRLTLFIGQYLVEFKVYFFI